MQATDYIILALMAAVVVVLLLGVANMMRGKDARRSNRLMAWRVALQGLALLLAAVFIFRHG